MFATKMKLVILILLFLLGTGCSVFGGGKDKAITFQLELEAGANTNLIDGQANPVAVRIYQLASDQVFIQSEFIKLYNADKQVLGSELVESRLVYPVLPDTSLTMTPSLNSKTRFLAILVEFADYKKAKGMAIVALPKKVDGKTKFIIDINGLRANISLLKKAPLWKKLI
jgi:type VI secretion system protein VasD